MLNNITPKQALQYLVITLAIILTSFIFEYLNYHIYFPALTGILIGVLLVILAFLIYRKLIINFQSSRQEIRSAFSQTEPLFFLHKTINFRKPLPALRSFAASPDFLALMTEIVLANKPKIIVEIGSGVSTLINGYLLEQIGEGKVYSLDHEKEFGDLTLQNIDNHELKRYAEVIIAPLKEYELSGKKWRWYELEKLLEKISTIDLLIVDGPPERIQKNARYPALPLLIDKMSENAIILVDDCKRKEDRETTRMWAKEFPQFSDNYIWLEKGAVVLK